MKVLHLPFTYWPDPCGGTEVYVASLARELAARGVSNVIAAPGTETASYNIDGMPVFRFNTDTRLTQDAMFGGGDTVAAEEFARIIDEEAPDCVHFHAFTSAVGRLCMAEAKRRSIPTVTTYHSPTTSCVRGTLMRWGEFICDGELHALRCAACFLNAHGMSKPTACAAAAASVLTFPLSRAPGIPNSARAVLGSSKLLKLRIDATKSWWTMADRIVALCEWTRKLLLRNGVPDTKVRKVRHGLPIQAPPETSSTQRGTTPLRLAYLGRLDLAKGIDLIVHALKRLPSLAVTVDLFVIQQAYIDPKTRAMRDEILSDTRLRLMAPIKASEIVPTLRTYHGLLVPSRGLETGPLVVLEAFAAGVPVIGSDLGGINEWVTHEHDGLLVRSQTVDAWAAAISRLVNEPDLIKQLTNHVRSPRSMRDVAQEMHSIYAELIAS